MPEDQKAVDPRDAMIAELADALQAAAINLSLPCNGGHVVAYEVGLVDRARAMITPT